MNKRILVIDDDEGVRDAFALALMPAGYEVVCADSGAAGIREATAHRPELIFLDLKMPEMDGVETLRQLKLLDPSLTVYIVTAFVREYMAQLEQARSAGLIFQIASKPLTQEQILQIAIAAIGHPQTDDAPKFLLTLYVNLHDVETDKMLAELHDALNHNLERSHWVLNVVDVLSMPEKAVANDIFTTPTLVREMPEPVLKVLGGISKLSKAIAIITHVGHQQTTMVI